jgi:outer membrane protein TolC
MRCRERGQNLREGRLAALAAPVVALATPVVALAAPVVALATPSVARAQPSAAQATSQTQAADVSESVRVPLGEAVRMALARDPTIVTAFEEIRRAEALLEETRSASLPTLTGNATYTRLDGDRVSSSTVTNVTAPGSPAVVGQVSLPRTVFAPIGQLGANLTLSVPLLAPKAWVAWSHAEDDVDVARASAADVRRAVAVAVARAYLTIVAQKRVIDAAVRARDTDNAHYLYAHQRFLGGIGNRIDEVRADQQRQSDEAALEQDYANLAREREALGVLVGAGGPLDAEEPNLQAGIDPGRAIHDAEHRSDVEAADMRRLASSRRVRDDWADYMPTLGAVFEPFYWNPASVSQPQTGFQAQLIFSIPLYDGGLRYGQAKERAALRDEAQTSLEATLRQARSDVRVAFEEVRRADAALASSRQAADLARSALDLAEIAYRGGAATNIEVIDAERTARDAETAVAVAEDGAREARLDLLAATGRFP